MPPVHGGCSTALLVPLFTTLLLTSDLYLSEGFLPANQDDGNAITGGFCHAQTDDNRSTARHRKAKSPVRNDYSEASSTRNLESAVIITCMHPRSPSAHDGTMVMHNVQNVN